MVLDSLQLVGTIVLKTIDLINILMSILNGIFGGESAKSERYLSETKTKDASD